MMQNEQNQFNARQMSSTAMPFASHQMQQQRQQQQVNLGNAQHQPLNKPFGAGSNGNNNTSNS